MLVTRTQVKDLAESFGWSALVIGCVLIVIALSGGLAWLISRGIPPVAIFLLRYPIVDAVIALAIFWGVKVDTRWQNKGSFLKAQIKDLGFTAAIIGSAILLCIMIWAYGEAVFLLGRITIEYPIIIATLVMAGITLFAIAIFRTPEPDYDAYYYPFD